MKHSVVMRPLFLLWTLFFITIHYLGLGSGHSPLQRVGRSLLGISHPSFDVANFAAHFVLGVAGKSVHFLPVASADKLVELFLGVIKPVIKAVFLQSGPHCRLPRFHFSAAPNNVAVDDGSRTVNSLLHLTFGVLKPLLHLLLLALVQDFELLRRGHRPDVAPVLQVVDGHGGTACKTKGNWWPWWYSLQNKRQLMATVVQPAKQKAIDGHGGTACKTKGNWWPRWYSLQNKRH